MGCNTDASHRFERGADLNACAAANALVAKLILGSGGALEGELVDVVFPRLRERRRTGRRFALGARGQRHLGATLVEQELGSELVARHVDGAGCVLTAKARTSLK